MTFDPKLNEGKSLYFVPTQNVNIVIYLMPYGEHIICNNFRISSFYFPAISAKPIHTATRPRESSESVTSLSSEDSGPPNEFTVSPGASPPGSLQLSPTRTFSPTPPTHGMFSGEFCPIRQCDNCIFNTKQLSNS